LEEIYLDGAGSLNRKAARVAAQTDVLGTIKSDLSTLRVRLDQITTRLGVRAGAGAGAGAGPAGADAGSAGSAVVNTPLEETTITNASLYGLSASCRLLTTLSVAGCVGVTDAGIMAVVNNCPNLAVLDISKCPFVTDITLHGLAGKCARLAALNAEYAGVSVAGVAAVLVARSVNAFSSLEVRFGGKLFQLVADIHLTLLCCRSTTLGIA
jgi:hypothetical protein